MTSPGQQPPRYVSRKANLFTESVIREMTREALKYGAVNLGQGFPDFAAPEDIKQKAIEAIAADHNQYAITWGVKSFRDAIAAKTKWFLGLEIDPETEITVTCGSTEGMIAAMMATVDEGDAGDEGDGRRGRRGRRFRAVLRELRPGRHLVRRPAAARPAPPNRRRLRI